MREVESVVHPPCTSKRARRVITCSKDGLLRLWDLDSDTQIGNDWRDGGEHARIRSIALSPNGKIVASGSNSGIVRLWDVEIGNVIAKWTGHTDYVCSVCWSPNGERVVSGSWDGTARVWSVEARHSIPYLALLKTGHDRVFAVVYSPDGSKIATGGYNENAVKIWDTKSGELLFTVGRGHVVWSLAWTSDGKKLISVSAATRSIGIFDTGTWQQTGTLQGANAVCTIALSPNDRLLASTSHNTARLWNLDTNLPVGLPFQHESSAYCAAFSADGTRLVTGCDENAYVWDVDAILKDADLDTIPKDAGLDCLPGVSAKIITRSSVSLTANLLFS
jgi:WD40 repeat protein